MKTLLFNYICGHCGNQFSAPGISDFVYGQFLLRTDERDKQEMVLLDCSEDPVYDEMYDLLKAQCDWDSFDTNEQVELIHWAFEQTCDKSPDGHRFFFSVKTQCPNCGCREMSEWSIKEPIKEVHLPSPSHTLWADYTEQEKLVIIEQKL